jgi:DNA-directed RNA polymerase specialized sigma24 family protein
LHSENKLIDVFAAKYTTLSKFAIMIVEDKDAALDVMQNVALVIATKAYEISEIKKPTAFLITCVRRAALNYLRNQSRVSLTRIGSSTRRNSKRLFMLIRICVM